jgi:hypothetical protein
MPVLLQELQHIHAQQGLTGLAERLCGIEELWHGEDRGAVPGTEGPTDLFGGSLNQLDLLLEEIRLEQQA